MNFCPTGIKADKQLSLRALDMAMGVRSNERSYWKMIPCRYTDGYAGRAARIMRMDATKKWEWKADDLSQTVKLLVEPFVHHYSHLTRVELLLQKPGEVVPCHKDIITGQSYIGNIALGDYKDDWDNYGKYCNADSHQHEKQHFLGGRLSLGFSERSYVMDLNNPQPHKSYYQFENEFFFLNEYVLHGADAVDFWRGVVFFDGIHDPDVMREYYDSA